jgi:hypothetical protein
VPFHAGAATFRKPSYSCRSRQLLILPGSANSGRLSDSPKLSLADPMLSFNIAGQGLFVPISWLRKNAYVGTKGLLLYLIVSHTII